MLEILVITIISALFNAFVLMFLRKSGILEQLQAKAGKFMYKVYTCAFCMSFYMTFMTVIPMVIITGDPLYLIIIFLSPPITAFIYE